MADPSENEEIANIALLDALTRYFGNNIPNGITFNKPGVRESCSFKHMQKFDKILSDLSVHGFKAIDIISHFTNISKLLELPETYILELLTRDMFRSKVIPPGTARAMETAFEKMISNMTENDFKIFGQKNEHPESTATLFDKDDENLRLRKDESLQAAKLSAIVEKMIDLYNELVNLINENQLLGILYHNFAKNHALLFQKFSGSEIFENPLAIQEEFLISTIPQRGTLDTRFSKIPPVKFNQNYKNFNSKVHLAQLCWILHIIVCPLSCEKTADVVKNKGDGVNILTTKDTSTRSYFNTFLNTEEHQLYGLSSVLTKLGKRLSQESKPLSDKYPHECVPLTEIALFCRSVVECVFKDYKLYFDMRIGADASENSNNYHTTMTALLLNLQNGDGVFHSTHVTFPAGFLPTTYHRKRIKGETYEQLYFKKRDRKQIRNPNFEPNIPNDNITIDWTPLLTVTLPNVYATGFKTLASYHGMDISGRICVALTCNKRAKYMCAGKFCNGKKFYCGEKCQKLDWIDHSTDNCC